MSEPLHPLGACTATGFVPGFNYAVATPLEETRRPLKAVVDKTTERWWRWPCPQEFKLSRSLPVPPSYALWKRAVPAGRSITAAGAVHTISAPTATTTTAQLVVDGKYLQNLNRPLRRLPLPTPRKTCGFTSSPLPRAAAAPATSAAVPPLIHRVSTARALGFAAASGGALWGWL